MAHICIDGRYFSFVLRRPVAPRYSFHSPSKNKKRNSIFLLFYDLFFNSINKSSTSQKKIKWLRARPNRALLMLRTRNGALFVYEMIFLLVCQDAQTGKDERRRRRRASPLPARRRKVFGRQDDETK